MTCWPCLSADFDLGWHSAWIVSYLTEQYSIKPFLHPHTQHCYSVTIYLQMLLLFIICLCECVCLADRIICSGRSWTENAVYLLIKSVFPYMLCVLLGESCHVQSFIVKFFSMSLWSLCWNQQSSLFPHSWRSPHAQSVCLFDLKCVLCVCCLLHLFQ